MMADMYISIINMRTFHFKNPELSGNEILITKQYARVEYI